MMKQLNIYQTNAIIAQRDIERTKTELLKELLGEADINRIHLLADRLMRLKRQENIALDHAREQEIE